MQIERIPMTRPHYQAGRPGPVRMVVLHATAGRSPGDLSWLRAGGDERRPVSAHYYIDKRGRIVQLVDDGDTAWHAGESRWVVDGHEVRGCNPIAIGVELENLNTGRDPYPTAQYAAALWLCRRLVERHAIPRGQLVRHLDIAPGRKTDPAGFPWAQFSAEVFTDLAPSDDAPPADQLRARLLDLAFRAAGGAVADRSPLFARAQAGRLGMPIAAPAGRPAPPAGGAAQDDHERALRVGEHGRFLIEIYARDLLYAPADPGAADLPAPDQIRRLGQTAAGPLRDALLDILFRQADPLSGFRADWAFHQRFLADPGRLGVPIGPSQRLRGADREYAYQHFALDSLCSPVGDWQTIYRRSELGRDQPGLTPAQARQLQRLLLDSLYREHAGRRYAPNAALVRYAEASRLGAPIGPPRAGRDRRCALPADALRRRRDRLPAAVGRLALRPSAPRRC